MVLGLSDGGAARIYICVGLDQVNSFPTTSMASHTNYNAFANDAEALAWARAFASRSSSNNQPTTSSSSTQQNQQTTTSSQGYQTNMQIVLQPAGDDSEEGGGRDDEDAGRKMYVTCLRFRSSDS